MSEKRMVRVAVWSLDFWDYYRKLRPFTEFVEEVAAALNKVPEQYRASVQIDAEQGGYDESAHVHAFYERPETDQEAAARVAEEEQYRQRQEERERAEYERLQRKFGR